MKKIKILKFGSSWCVGCSSTSAILKKLSHPLLDTMQDIDIDTEPDAVLKYAVRSIPTLIIVDQDTGTERARLTGAQSENRLLEFLDSVK